MALIGFDTLPSTASETAQRIQSIRNAHGQEQRVQVRNYVQPRRKLEREPVRHALTVDEWAEVKHAIENLAVPATRSADRDCR